MNDEQKELCKEIRKEINIEIDFYINQLWTRLRALILLACVVIFLAFLFLGGDNSCQQ